MILSDVTLVNFRGYQKRSFRFSQDTTLITGRNTSGKTNLLEALSMLATGKSFRADSDRDCIRWGSDNTLLKGKLGDTTLEIRLTATAKKYLVNGVSRRLVDFAGHLRIVLFWPEHLELITDSPSLRRKYLDSVLVQVDREYRRHLLSYERGLRQRNRLLDLINEGKAHRHQLLFWDQLLMRSGGYITDARSGFIAFVNAYRLSSMPYALTYDKSVISQSRLAQYAAEEVAAKATLVGPHRDDFVVNQKERDLSAFGSRGEQRLAILWLKLAELEFIKQVSGERPVLLLDDIFSELDDPHRVFILELLGKQQTIITSAEDSTRALLTKHRIKADTIQL